METLPILVLGYGVLLLYMSALFLCGYVAKNNGVADVGYGMAFLVFLGTLLSYMTPVTGYHALVAALPFVWGTRLAWRIFFKNLGKPEDFRYRAWRDAWGRSFLVRSFFQIYMLQGTIVFFIALPVVLALLYPALHTVAPLVIVGIGVWFVGFMIEASADAQLDHFLKHRPEGERIMTRGLWHYSRHPNYFGESLMWWGIAIAASGLTSLWYIGFISPVLITALLLFISGVPMLERRFAGDPEWEAYKAKTSVFFLWPPK